jgi:Adenylate and Guanylate cyclase catalytic domain/PEGA domain
MEERSKTIMCSVLFLDIVEYSKKSVSGQISLKERFNAFLSMAIRDVPLDDRIILDTGDGAALSFLGDVEDALQVALSLRESLRSESAHMDPPLLIRMGVNLGPVRLVKDINGQPNIVGDGINVAQRVMGFADPGQIMVSRSYYDAVSRLSHEYGGMFHYQGSRTDKHVREHEIYAIGYPGEFTLQQPTAGKTTVNQGGMKQQLGKSWQNAAQWAVEMVQAAVAAYQTATPRLRAAYAGGVASIFVLIMVVELLTHHAPKPKAQVAETTAVQAASQTAAAQAVLQAAAVQAVSQAAQAVSQAAQAVSQAAAVQAAASRAGAKAPETKEENEGKETTKEEKEEASAEPSKPSTPEDKAKRKSRKKSHTKIFGIPIPSKGEPGFVAVRCTEGSSVFVDGFSKGIVGKEPLNISLDPGKHHLTISQGSKQSVYSKTITIKTGETIHLHPAFCK